jgi:Uma2 family endonuclease
MSTVLQYPQRHPISAQEYLRMAQAGVFAPDFRLELVEGEILEMAPIGSAHASAVNTLNRLFVHLAGDDAIVSVQNPIVLGRQSVPRPDLALLRPRSDNYFGGHPAAADVLLFVEVADTTLTFDTGAKVSLYARHGIPEVWVVDLDGRAVRVYRDPTATGYKTTFRTAGGERLAALALPQVIIEPRQLFGS